MKTGTGRVAGPLSCLPVAPGVNDAIAVGSTDVGSVRAARRCLGTRDAKVEDIPRMEGPPQPLRQIPARQTPRRVMAKY
jgi:hypothetical protein